MSIKFVDKHVGKHVERSWIISIDSILENCYHIAVRIVEVSRSTFLAQVRKNIS